MITDDEVMRVLEQANPASVDDPIPMLDIAGYRDVLDATNTTMTLTHNEPTPSESSSGRWWRVLIAAAAAAVVVVIAFVATRNDEAAPADQPLPTVTMTPTTTTPARAIPARGIAPGTYFVDHVRLTPTPRIFVTVGAGWTGIGLMKEDGLQIMNGYIGLLSLSRVDAVFSDACHPSDGFHPGPVDTVDGLVAALREQQGGWTDVTAPSDVSIDGYTGKAFQRTAPTDFSSCETGSVGTRLSGDSKTNPNFASWRGAGWDYHEPGQTETLWVLDIEGTVVVIEAGVWPGPSWAARADVAAAVLDSIRIDRPPSSEQSASVPNLSTPPVLSVGGRQWGAGAVVPDLGQFPDKAALLDALAASGPLENQLLSDPNLRPRVSICADMVRYHEPTVGTLVHEAIATLNRKRGIVLVFKQPDNSTEVRMYGTGEADPDTGGCPLLM